MEIIKDKVVVVTGASSGIGEATALLLAGQGAKVVLGARREAKLRDLAEQIKNAGGEAAYLSTDVTKRKQVADLVNLARERFGRIDVLVNNAGIALNSPLDDLKVDDWEQMIDVNLKSVLYGIAAALPIFRQQGSGHFINIVSTAGLRIVPMQVVYAGTKNAVRTITEGLRQEAGDKLRVTMISPGFINTNLANSIADETVRAETLKKRDEIAIPPEAIARAVIYAMEQPATVDVGDIVVRPTAQS